MLFGVMHGSLRWFKPQGRLSLEALAQQCVSAMVFPPGTVARVAGTASPAACDTVAVVRQANGLAPLAAQPAAVPAESPLTQHGAKNVVKAVSPRAARAGKGLRERASPAKAKDTRST